MRTGGPIPVTERARRFSLALVAGLMIVFLAGVMVLAFGHLRHPVQRLFHSGLHPGTILLPALAITGMLLAVLLAFLASRRWPRATLAAALLAVVGVRLAISLAYEAPQVSDWHTYELLASGLLHGQVPFADRPMGWPVMLAAAWSLFGATVRTGVLLNVALAGLTGLALAAWLRMIAGTRVAAVGVTAYAVFPSHALWVLLLATEVPYTLAIMTLVLAVTWLLLPGRVHTDRVKFVGLFGVGLLLGLSYWIRSNSILLIPLVALLPAVLGARRRQALAGAVAVLLGVAIPLIPIVGWNATVLQRTSLSNSVFAGWQLYVGNNEGAGGAYNTQDNAYAVTLGQVSIAAPFATGAVIDDGLRRSAAADGALFNAGVDRLLNHGTRLPAFILRKIDRGWSEGTPAAGWAVTPTAPVANRKLLIAQLAAAGDLAWALVLAGALAWYWRRRHDPGLTGVVVGSIVLLLAAGLVLLEVQPRYHEYVVPLLIGLASISAVSLGEAAIHRRGRYP